MNELLKIMTSRRSVRKYSEDSVSDEDIKMILQAGLLSPSGKAVRPWEFIVIKDKEILIKLADARTGAADMLINAYCAIVVIGDKDKTDVWIEDCSIAMTQMHLMADSLGLGSCWIQGRMRTARNGKSSNEYMAELLGYPNGYELEAILFIGIPADKRPPYEIPEITSDKVHWEKY